MDGRTYPAELDDADRHEWRTAEMTCAVCSFQWVAVYPDCAPSLECSRCKHMNTLPT